MEGEILNLTILKAIQSMEKSFNEQLLELPEQSIQSSCMFAPDMEEQQLEEATDIVHRVSRKDDNRKRHTFVLFVRRHVNEEIWQRCRDSPVCREKGICLTETLRLDREPRKQLWPQIEQACLEGKQAHYHGPHGYIEGRQMG